MKQILKIISSLLILIIVLEGDILILHSSNDGKTSPSNIQYLEKLQKIANTNGIKIKFKPTPWKRALLMVEKGKADGVINASYKIDRAKYAVYPMANGKLDGARRLNSGKSYYIYKNRNSTINWDGQKFTNVDGAVGAVTKFAVIDDLKKHKNIKIEIRNNKISLIRDMAMGNIAAYAGMIQDVDKVLKKHSQFAKRIVRESLPIRKKDYFLIFSKKTYQTKKIQMEKIWDGLKDN